MILWILSRASLVTVGIPVYRRVNIPPGHPIWIRTVAGSIAFSRSLESRILFTCGSSQLPYKTQYIVGRHIYVPTVPPMAFLVGTDCTWMLLGYQQAAQTLLRRCIPPTSAHCAALFRATTGIPGYGACDTRWHSCPSSIRRPSDFPALCPPANSALLRSITSSSRSLPTLIAWASWPS